MTTEFIGHTTGPCLHGVLKHTFPQRRLSDPWYEEPRAIFFGGLRNVEAGSIAEGRLLMSCVRVELFYIFIIRDHLFVSSLERRDLI